MADISDVNASVIKDLHHQLESLSCMFLAHRDRSEAQLIKLRSSDYDKAPILNIVRYNLPVSTTVHHIICSRFERGARHLQFFCLHC